MKTLTFSTLFLFLIAVANISAQESTSGERYGHTLNIGLGLGYYGYVGHTIPVIHADYEFGVLRNFTLAPFVSFYSYSNGYYYNGSKNQNYYYHETVVPIGVKGTYYFDDLLKVNSNWDLYLGAAIGAAISNSYWDNGYPGDRNYYHGASPLFIDIHMGAEYHFNNRIGMFLDLSTGVSTIGLAIH